MKRIDLQVRSQKSILSNVPCAPGFPPILVLPPSEGGAVLLACLPCNVIPAAFCPGNALPWVNLLLLLLGATVTSACCREVFLQQLWK